jgi:hypothetical protein
VNRWCDSSATSIEIGPASPPYYPVASGPTLEDATDAAIARYNQKHNVSPTATADVLVLEVRGWVS